MLHTVQIETWPRQSSSLQTMRFCYKAVLGILVVAALAAVIAGLFVGVRHHVDASSINIDPATLVTL